MTSVAKRTNSDRVQPYVDAAKGKAVELGRWAQTHPDEAVLAITPTVLLMTATRRHQLTFTEAMIIAEIGYWCGLLAAKTYRDWKAKPAEPALRRVM